MNVLLIGSGGREHAIAWKLSQSPLLTHLYIAPGNIGMLNLGTLVPLAVEDSAGLLAFAQNKAIDFIVIGPEAALAAGVSDVLRAHGFPVFGPSQAAARIESSKVFSKEFMQRHHIPTARFKAFSDYQAACDYLGSVSYPVVIKASGLAAGKGVILPDTLQEGLTTLQEIMVGGQFGKAGEEVVIEERLEGEEVSLLAFCDGKSVSVMPPAQDHKRLLDNDKGPNTGGMGAYAPAPCLSNTQIETVIQTVLQPTVDGLKEEGLPYIGVLYAGLMLTDDGIKVLEFNARFGDPETQAILPLLETDLLEIFEACTIGTLSDLQIQWSEGAAVCVVLASGGYPGKLLSGYPITGLDTVIENGMVFHAGTRLEGIRPVNSGGRVLGVTCWNSSLRSAIEHAYLAVTQISFTGMQYRQDIAQKGLKSLRDASTYQSAGVDIEAGNRAVRLMKDAVHSTYNDRVLAGIGSFGGLFDASNLGEQPVLVASTDGVGTKVELASRFSRLDGVGKDIVNHCINDILVQGARPLFFLDYFATAKLKPELVAEIVAGMASACREAGCALLGGETAEMPGVYHSKAFDVAGTIIGVVERNKIMPDLPAMQEGDLLLGFASSGPHTNGYSLIRKICQDHDLLAYKQELKSNLADALLASHRSYLNTLQPVLPMIKGLAHITGGGFIENIPRALPDHLQPVIDLSSWPIPPLFQWLQAQGGIELEEMFHVFNMGIGMLAVVCPDNLEKIRSTLSEPAWVIGKLSKRTQSRGIVPMKKATLVVLISGNGSNLQALIDATRSGRLPAEILAVVSNTKDAYGLERARLAGIPALVKPKLKIQEREVYDAELADLVMGYKPDLVILAGWMRILTMAFIGHFPQRIVNLHPALPGTFPGVNAIERAFGAYQQGEISHTGVMVHLVPDEGVDLGPVLGQRVVEINSQDTLEDLEKRVHASEHELLVETITHLIHTMEENHA